MSFAKAFPVVALAALLWPVACGTQSEGQRCDWRNGNDDCASGLECKRVSELSGPKTSVGDAALCCPRDTTAATVDICRGIGQLPSIDAGADGSVGPDASKDGAVGSDAGTGGSSSADAGNRG